MVSYYVAVFEKSEDGYGVFFPEVLGCTSSGETVAEAAKNAAEALEGHLTLAIEHGEAIPAPTGQVDMPVDPEVQEVCRLLVGFEPSAKPMRVNITLPENLLTAVDSFAAKHGFTRSGFLAEAARARIRRDLLPAKLSDFTDAQLEAMIKAGAQEEREVAVVGGSTGSAGAPIVASSSTIHDGRTRGSGKIAVHREVAASDLASARHDVSGGGIRKKAPAHRKAGS